MYARPRFDFTADYFVKIYRAECVCLRLHSNFIKSVLDAQVCGGILVDTFSSFTCVVRKYNAVVDNV